MEVFDLGVGGTCVLREIDGECEGFAAERDPRMVVDLSRGEGRGGCGSWSDFVGLVEASPQVGC